MHWAVFTTRCSDFQLETEQLPYQAVTQFIRMFSIAQQEKFPRMSVDRWFFVLKKKIH